MSETRRTVHIVGGPHDGSTVGVDKAATSAVLYCWDNKPISMKPAKGPRRHVSVYTQRGDDVDHFIYKADAKVEIVE